MRLQVWNNSIKIQTMMQKRLQKITRNIIISAFYDPQS